MILWHYIRMKQCNDNLNKRQQQQNIYYLHLFQKGLENKTRFDAHGWGLGWLRSMGTTEYQWYRNTIMYQRCKLFEVHNSNNNLDLATSDATID